MGKGRNQRNHGWRRGHGKFRNLFHGRGFTPGPAVKTDDTTSVQKPIIRAEVDLVKCIGCGLCARICRSEAIEMTDGIAVVNEKCVGCGMCVRKCPEQAISLSESTIAA